MKILTGHLTTTDKKAINAILEAGLLSGRVGKANYFLTQLNGTYSVCKQIKDRGLIPVAGSELRISKYYAQFTL